MIATDVLDPEEAVEVGVVNDDGAASDEEDGSGSGEAGVSVAHCTR